jgi:hypothetical protein
MPKFSGKNPYISSLLTDLLMYPICDQGSERESSEHQSLQFSPPNRKYINKPSIIHRAKRCVVIIILVLNLIEIQQGINT